MGFLTKFSTINLRISHPKKLTTSLTMSQFESMLGSSSSMMDSRGDLQTRKDRATRTLRHVGTCKGVFTKEIKKLSSTAEYFLTKTADLTVDQINSPDLSLINCAQGFLDSLDRLIAKFIDMVTNLDD